MKNILDKFTSGRVTPIKWDIKSASNYFNSLCIAGELLCSAINKQIDDTQLYLFKISENGAGEIFDLKEDPISITKMKKGRWISIISFSKKDNVIYISPCNQMDPKTLKTVINNINPNFFNRCTDYISMPKKLSSYLVELLIKDYNVKGFSFDDILKESRCDEFNSIYKENLKTSGNIFTIRALEDKSFLDKCIDMYKSSPSYQEEI